MNPTAAGIAVFQAQFRQFRGTQAKVLHVVSDVGDFAALEQTLRAEEWRPENRAPFLIFTQPYETGDACLSAMAAQLREHYERLRAGVLKEGGVVPQFGQVEAASAPSAYLIACFARWIECTVPLLEEPLVCWLAPTVANASEFRAVLIELLRHTSPKLRFVVADDTAASRLGTALTDAGVTIWPATFRIDEQAMKAWYTRVMLAEPRKGRAPGAPAGAAAPDVEPPRRPGPQPATDEQVRATLAAHGLPPVLTPSQGESLQRLIFAAADAVSADNSELAYRHQYDAYALCGRAHVKLEQGIMALILAGYLIRFQQVDEALEWFEESARLTQSVGANAQVSQALMGAGYVHFAGRRFDEAAEVYGRAANAAKEAGSFLLVLENLRMAGVCFQQLGRSEEMIRCWLEATQAGERASPGEIAASSFQSVAADLRKELEQRAMQDEINYIDTVQRNLASAADTPVEVS